MYAFLALLVGALSSVQSRVNGQLAIDIHSAIGAAIISNAIGLVFLSVLVLGRQKERAGFGKVFAAIGQRKLQWWEMLGGAAGAIFLTIQSFSVPEIGVGIFTICVVGGQTASSLVVDKIGLSTNGKQGISRIRIFTAMMTLIAVTIAVYPDLGNANFKIITILLCLFVGVVVSFQHAINSRVNHVSSRPLVTTSFNFIVASIFLLVALGVDFMRGGSIGPLPHNFWVYIGGPCGLLFIAVASKVVKSLGVLNFTLFVVTGQLAGALLLDWLLPTHNAGVSLYLIAGTAITLGSISFAKVRENSKVLK